MQRASAREIHVRPDVRRGPVRVRTKENSRVKVKNDKQIIIGGEKYEGAYMVTPGSVAQVLSTKDRLLGEDVVISPIPKNWGLVEFDGSTLTVS